MVRFLSMVTLTLVAKEGRNFATADDLWAPFDWSTAGSRLYSFCSNASGALSEQAVAALSKSKLMIHGMEVISKY